MRYKIERLLIIQQQTWQPIPLIVMISSFGSSLQVTAEFGNIYIQIAGIEE